MDFCAILRAIADASIIIGSIAACLSPLCTLAALWQMKEWRWDRLLEHLRREGWLEQLVGMKRLIVMGVWAFAYIITRVQHTPPQWAWLGLLPFIVLGLLQMALRRQRFPKPTSKALATLCIALTMDAALAWLCIALGRPQYAVVLCVTQAPVLALAWTLLLPLDRQLKRRALARGAQARARLGDIPVIAIAGSVGKTTTKALLAHLLSDLQPTATPAHVNTEMGVAAWLERLADTTTDTHLLIVEMGAYRTGEIAVLCQIAKPTAGILTAVGSDHLALFGSEEAIAAANAELLAALPPTGWAVVNADSAPALGSAGLARCAVTLTGASDAAALRASAVQEGPDGLTFLTDTTPQWRVPLHGTHMVQNVLLAIAAARKMGVSDERIAQLLASFQHMEHTFSVQTRNGVRLLDDTYNISPLSMRAGIAWAGQQQERPRILLTSGLLETGKEEVRFLHELGAFAKGKIERVIFTVDRGREAFAASYGAPVELLEKSTPRLAAGALLVCLGRMRENTIDSLLP